MKLRHYIAMDMHCSHTTLEAQTRAGHVQRFRKYVPWALRDKGLRSDCGQRFRK